MAMVFAFDVALTTFGKVCVWIYALQIYINSRADGFFGLLWQSVKEKEILEFKPVKLRLKPDIVSHLARNFQVLQSQYQSFDNRAEHTSYIWYHFHLHVP